MQHPHLIERQTVQTVHDRLLGDIQVPGFPLRFSSFPERLELDAPFLGEHNEKILSSYLGYTRAQMRASSATACCGACRARPRNCRCRITPEFFTKCAMESARLR